jgi:KUP system potassium uptake protein
VLAALSPMHGVRFLAANGVHGFVLVGLVFLAVTGGEALYACMGQFGRTPIRIAWFTVAVPSLLLNYIGQAALVMTRPAVTNPFYAMVDGPLLIPMMILAVLAAAIAAQTLISVVFSLTRQATQLGFWPRATVVHTSATAEGQVYIPEMNWLLMLGGVLLVLAYPTSAELAAAYGIAVSGIMGITSYLFYVVCRQRWRQSRVRVLMLLVPFLAIDLALFSANAARFAGGAWLPLAIGACLLAVMTTWWRGRMELSKLMEAGSIPEALLFAEIAAQPPLRVSGTAVFMASKPEGMPNVLLHHFKHHQSLHAQVVMFSVQTELVPWIGAGSALDVTDLGHGFFRVVARVGFMETPDIPQLLRQCETRGISADPMTTTYYLGRQTLLTGGRTRLARWRKLLFAFLSRNAPPSSSFFHLPPNRVVELGLQIEL